MSEQRSISMYEYAILYDFAENKFSSIPDEETRTCAIYDWISLYINGSNFLVYNDRNQFKEEFDWIEDALEYIEENEPKNEMWYIELEGNL